MMNSIQIEVQPNTESSERSEQEWQLSTLKKITKFEKDEVPITKLIYNTNESNLRILKYLLEQIIIFKTNVQFAADSIMNSTTQSINLIENENKKLKQQSIDYSISFADITQLEQSKNLIIQHFTDLQSITKIEPFFMILNEINYSPPIIDLTKLFTENEKIQEETISTVDEKFEYQLINEIKTQLKENCCAFTFNTSQTLLFIAYWKMIIVQEFDDGNLQKELQWLTCHTKQIQSLCYSKCDCLISGSEDKQIIIWKQQVNKQWIVVQILKEHQQSINCLILYDHGESFISGSFDKTIKFWSRQKRGWICNQTAFTYFYIFGLCINEQENILLIYGIEKKILVLQRNSDSEWIYSQTIETDQISIRLNFINNTQFIVCFNNSNILELYKQEQNNQFHIQQQVQINDCEEQFLGFPSQFIKQKNILMIKKGRCINLFKIQNYGQINLQQQVIFDTQNLNGIMTIDGKYLITWNNHSKSFQIRKFQSF